MGRVGHVLCVVMGIVGVWFAPLPVHAQRLGCDETPETHLIMGGIAEGSKDYTQALYQYDCALVFNDTAPEIYLARGRVNYALENWTAATNDFDKVITLAPDSPDGYIGRAEVSYRLKWDEFTLKDAYDAVQIAPNDPRAFYLRGITYVRLGDFENAKLDLDLAQELNYQPKTALLEALADLAIAQDDPQTAVDYLAEVVRLNPQSDKTYLQMGKLYDQLKRPEEALGAYETYLFLSNRADPEIVRYVASFGNNRSLLQQLPLIVISVLAVLLMGRGAWWAVVWQKRRASVAIHSVKTTL